MSLRDALNKRMDEGDLGGYVRRGTRSSGIDVFDYMNGFYGQNKKLVM